MSASFNLSALLLLLVLLLVVLWYLQWFHLYLPIDLSFSIYVINTCVQYYCIPIVIATGCASCSSGETKEAYGLPCRPLEIGDICLPPHVSQQIPTAKDSEGYMTWTAASAIILWALDLGFCWITYEACLRLKKYQRFNKSQKLCIMMTMRTAIQWKPIEAKCPGSNKITSIESVFNELEKYEKNVWWAYLNHSVWSSMRKLCNHVGISESLSKAVWDECVMGISESLCLKQNFHLVKVVCC